jgi:UDP-N-acetylmuramoyl-L-alanyl-D-glutamate--2,6-diaminopimelate ligase
MRLQELVKNVNFKGTSDDREISAITYDSRKVKPGTLFVAIAGEQSDGHEFIPQAIKNGAVAILSNGRSPKTSAVPILQVKDPRLAMSRISAQFYGNPSTKINIVGITGTNGKTSITHILHHILQTSSSSCGTLGTLGFQTPTGMVSTGFTTPESVELQQMIHTLQIAGVDNLVMEISSHALDLHRVNDVDIDIAVFTNLTPDHLDFHGDMEKYFKSKLQLFQSLSKTNTAIINLDDPYAQRICSATAAKIITFGMNKKANLHPVHTEFTFHGIKAELQFEKKTIPINTTLIGEYNLSNIMAGVAVGISMGISTNQIEKALKSMPPIPGRMEHISCKCPGKVFIDYAHSPDAYEKLFSNLVNLTENKLNIYTIFGCGGNRDTGKRSEMANISEKYAAFSYVTMDNPRDELLEKINADIIQGFSSDRYIVIPDRKEAITTALKQMDENSILLVLGKGRENYQKIGLEKIPHSDIKIIKEYSIAG